MAEDEDVSRRYRELAREEPPRHVDEAIRAAARRAVASRPAPLVGPGGRQRWYFPLAAAAIVVLAVAVTLHVEREQPGEEVVAANSAPMSSPAAPAPETLPEKPEARAQAKQERKLESPDPAELRADRNVQESAAMRRAEPAPSPPPPPAAAAAGARPEARTQAATPQRAEQMSRDSSPLAKLADRAPEQWLQGIAELRAQGRHEEADKELAEFRKRYPEYQIPQTMREKIEKSTR